MILSSSSPQAIFNPIAVIFALTLCTAGSLAGCISTEKRFERAINYEESGDYTQAARHYLQVLQRDSGMKQAREGLERTGAIAIRDYLNDAEQKEMSGAYDDAISVLDVLDEFRTDAMGVGVDLSVPSDYATYRDRLAAAAVQSLISRGEQAEDQGKWEEALELYDRVVTRYDLSVDATEQMRLSQARVYVKWGTQDIEQSYHRSAFDRAASAIQILGESHPRAIAAIDLQDRALAEGTRYVAFFPTSIPENVTRGAPKGLLPEFNDMMQYEFWAAPPAFINSSDPVQMRRELRRRNQNTPLTPSDGVQIGRILESDYILLSQAAAFQVTETRVRDKTIAAKTRGRNSLDTTYVQRSYTAELEAEIVWSLMDVESRREVEGGQVDTKVSARMERGVYSGDYRDLALSYSEQRLFDEEEQQEAMRDLEDELLDALAPEFADVIFEHILKQID